MDTKLDAAGPARNHGDSDRGAAAGPDGLKYFTTSDGLRLAYRDEGEGVPVLCLAGLSRTMGDFDPIAAAFAERIRVIRMDYRGRGASDRDPNYRNYTAAIEGRDALELLDHLGIAKACILGTSRGGLIALLLASVARDRLLGVVFNDIGPEIDNAGLERIFTYLGVIPKAPDLDTYARLYAERAAGEFPGVSAATWRWFLGNNMRDGASGIELGYDPALRTAFKEQFSAATGKKAEEEEPVEGGGLWPAFDALEGLPLLVLRGENSDILSVETVGRMRARRPDMGAVTVRDRGHIPFLDEPECADALAEYFGALPR